MMPICCRGTLPIQISALHAVGLHNDLADDLSRNSSPSFLKKKPDASIVSSVIPTSLLQWLWKPGLVLSNLDAAVYYFCSQGIAPSTHSTYQSVLRKFAEFC